MIEPDDDDLAADADADDDADAADAGGGAGGDPAAFADLGPWWAPPPGVDLGQTAHLDAAGQPRIIERRLVVTDEHAGARLDHYLVRMIPRLSRTRIQQVIATQLERADGRRPRPGMTVAAGDELILRRTARAEPPCPRTFGVLYQDAELLVVDKPAGLPVHASAKFYWNTLARVVAERFPDTRGRSATASIARPRARWRWPAPAPPPPRSRARSSTSAPPRPTWPSSTASRRGPTPTGRRRR